MVSLLSNLIIKFSRFGNSQFHRRTKALRRLRRSANHCPNLKADVRSSRSPARASTHQIEFQIVKERPTEIARCHNGPLGKVHREKQVSHRRPGPDELSVPAAIKIQMYLSQSNRSLPNVWKGLLSGAKSRKVAVSVLRHVSRNANPRSSNRRKKT